MAFQLLHWCLTRRGETEGEKTERLMNAELENDSEFLSEEANRIFLRMKLQADCKVGLLHHYKIGDEAMCDIFKHFGKNTIVLQLNLSHNIISDEGAGYCAQAMRHNSTLQVLDLSYNNIGNEGAARLAKCLKDNTTLTALQLSMNEFDDEGGAILAEALHDNKSISTLCLGDTDISDKCVGKVVDAVEGSKSLTRLDFYNTKISDSGAKRLAEVLNNNGTLETLNLSKNQITDEGAVPLVATLATNYHLRTLELYDNKISPATITALTEALSTNTSLTQLNIGGNTLPKPVLETFNEKIASYKKREVCTSGLKYVNTYQCADWGCLDKGAEEKYRRWLAAMKDKGGLPVEIPCQACEKTLRKHKKSPWPAWNCKNCGEQFTQTEPCYGCGTPKECRSPFCVPCYDKQAEVAKKEQAEHVEIPCPTCNEVLVSKEGTGPYCCVVCSLEFPEGEVGFSCGKYSECKYALCPACHGTRVDKLRVIKRGGFELPCKKCKEGTHRLPTTPFATWDCDACNNHFTKANPCYGCISVRECDYSLCDVCWIDASIKLLESKKVAIPVPCQKCGDRMNKYPTTPFPSWGCDMCGEAYEQSDAIHGCKTMQQCDFCYCAKCYSQAEAKVKEEMKSRIPVPCGKCMKPSEKYDPNPFQAWGCDRCETPKAQQDPCYGCATMVDCDFCMCEACFTSMHEKLFITVSRGDAPCHRCCQPMVKYAPSPFPSWGCDGCGCAFSQEAPLFGCPTVTECDFCFCEGCHEKSKQAAAQRLRPKPRMPNTCRKCSTPLSRLDPCPFPAWGCDGCGSNFTAANPVFGCPTVTECDFCFCEQCFAKATQMAEQMQKKMEEEEKEEGKQAQGEQGAKQEEHSVETKREQEGQPQNAKERVQKEEQPQSEVGAEGQKEGGQPQSVDEQRQERQSQSDEEAGQKQEEVLQSEKAETQGQEESQGEGEASEQKQPQSAEGVGEQKLEQLQSEADTQKQSQEEQLQSEGKQRREEQPQSENERAELPQSGHEGLQEKEPRGEEAGDQEPQHREAETGEQPQGEEPEMQKRDGLLEQKKEDDRSEAEMQKQEKQTQGEEEEREEKEREALPQTAEEVGGHEQLSDEAGAPQEKQLKEEPCPEQAESSSTPVCGESRAGALAEAETAQQGKEGDMQEAD